MRVSREMASKVFYALIKKRDNTKGNLTEIEWYSFLHTINVINDAIQNDEAMVGGHPFSKFEILSNLSDLILPKVVKHELTSAERNLVDYSLMAGETEIADGEYSLSTTPLKELEAKEIIKASKKLADKKKEDEEDEVAATAVHNLQKGKVDVLSPDDFRLIQDALCNQVSKKDASYVKVDTLTTSEKLNVEYSTVKSRAVFGADCFNENTKQGFRPVGMNKEMFPYLNMRFANYDTNENFYTWFNNKIFG